MNNFRLLMFLLFIIFRITSTEGTKKTRKLNGELNPNCPPNICNTKLKTDEIITVVHIIAEGENDLLHYVWDFTGKPTVLIALTPLNTSLQINWKQFMDDQIGSISFNQSPYYSGAAILNRLWEFNDVDDSGSFPITNSSEIISFDTRNFTWYRNHFNKSPYEVEVSVTGDNAYHLGEGRIKLKLKCFGVQDYDIEFPHLLHSENSTQFDITLDNIDPKKKFESARFAIELVLLTDERNIVGRESFSMHKRKSIDDHHTPGIFELVEISSPESFKASQGNFIQYRPVSYTHQERDVSTSTEVHITSLVNIDNALENLNTSLAFLYYGYSLNKILIQSCNISFGFAGDGFYNKTRYNSWTFIMAYGAPPNEQFSMFVIIVACIGLGIPLLLLVGSGCFICIRRTRNC